MAVKLYGKRKWPSKKGPDGSKRAKPKKGREQKLNEKTDAALKRRGGAR